MKSLEAITEEFQKLELDKVLSQLTEDQRRIFWNFYPNGVSIELVPLAHEYCRRKIKENKSA